MRVKGIRFLPSSINFSDLAPNKESTFYDEDEQAKRDVEIDKELLLLKSIKMLDSDKEKCVILFEILREYGYQLDYRSIAHALNVKLRWFMRVKKTVRSKVNQITSNV